VVTQDDQGAGPIIAQGFKTLKVRQVAFDAEITVIEEALMWFQESQFQHLLRLDQRHRQSETLWCRTWTKASEGGPRHLPRS